MKKRIAAFLLLIILLSLPTLAQAQDIVSPNTRTYELSEIGVTISLPSRYFVITTATTQAELDSSGLSDISAAEWVQSLLDSDTYLEAVDFSNAAGGLYAQSSPDTSPASSVYVSFYPYEEIEAEFAYDASLDRREWLMKYYTNSDVSYELSTMGIFYTPDGEHEYAGQSWSKLIYSSGLHSSDGIEYFLPLGDGELVVCIFSGNNRTLGEQEKSDFESIMSSITLQLPEVADYTAIITIITIALSLGLLVLILAFKNK